jgi:hypothetical protein
MASVLALGRDESHVGNGVVAREPGAGGDGHRLSVADECPNACPTRRGAASPAPGGGAFDRIGCATGTASSMQFIANGIQSQSNL